MNNFKKYMNIVEALNTTKKGTLSDDFEYRGMTPDMGEDNIMNFITTDNDVLNMVVSFIRTNRSYVAKITGTKGIDIDDLISGEMGIEEFQDFMSMLNDVYKGDEFASKVIKFTKEQIKDDESIKDKKEYMKSFEQRINDLQM